MDHRVLKTIVEAIQILNSGKIEFGIGSNVCSVYPSFNHTRKKITCPQVEYFGFYALRNAFRGVYLGTNFLIAGQYMVSAKLYAPSVALFYTASYHAMLSFLALHGRVLIDLNTTNTKFKDGASELIAGILTKEKKWIFERRKRTHIKRWSELQSIFIGMHYEVPIYFQDLFHHLLGKGLKDRMSFNEYFDRRFIKGENIKPGTPYDLRNDLNEFLRLIPQTRHFALYGSFGSDPEVYEGLYNRDTFSKRGIDNQAILFEQFTTRLFLDICESLNQVTNRIKVNEKTKDMLVLSVHEPWFDEIDFDRLESSEVGPHLKALNEWLMQ